MTVSLGYVEAQNDGYNGIPYGPNYNDPTTTPPFSAPGESLQGFYDTLVPDSTAGYGETKQLNGSLDLIWTFDSMTVKSITGYSNIDDIFRFDLNGGANQFAPGPGNVLQGVTGIYVRSDSNNKTFTQELMFQGEAFGDSLEWIAGGFYMQEDGQQDYNPALTNAFSPTYAVADEINEKVATHTESTALYVEGTWNFTDALALTLGGRWTEDKKQFNEECTNEVGPTFGFPGCLSSPTFTREDWYTDLDETFKEFTPRALLQYSLNEGTSFYGSYSKGFQAGGFQTLCFGVQGCAEQVYDPQKVDSYELGAKTEFLDRTLRTNVALFYADYKDMQQTGIASGAGPLFPVVNVGDATVTGLELEMNWAPTESLNAVS